MGHVSELVVGHDQPIMQRLLKEFNGFITNENVQAKSIDANYALRNGTIGPGLLAPDSVGASEIIDLSVGTAELADASVTSRKWAPTSGIVKATSDLTLVNGTWNDVPSATVTFTPETASIALVFGIFNFYLSETDASEEIWAQGALNVDGSRQTSIADMRFGNAAGGVVFIDQATVTQVWRVALTAASHTLKLQAQKTNVGGSSGTHLAGVTDTQLLYLVHSQ